MTIFKYKRKKECGQMVRLSEQEAYALIESLAAQLRHRSPNVGREEFYTSDTGEYFSIAVHREPKNPQEPKP